MLSLLLSCGLELKFEDWLDHNVELVRVVEFNFYICIYV